MTGKQLICENCGKVNQSPIFALCECSSPDFRFELIEEYEEYVKDPDVKIYTIGQMIDTLKDGEIAEGINGYLEGTKLQRGERAGIVYVGGSIFSNNGYFDIGPHYLSSKWKIYKDDSCIIDEDEEELKPHTLQ